MVASKARMHTGATLLVSFLVLLSCFPATCKQWGKKSLSSPSSIRGVDISPRAAAAGGYKRSGWIQDFCSKPGNEFFAEVPVSFIRERMNTIEIGRGVDIPYMEEALAVILDERCLNVGEASIVESSAALLYGLLHARFLVSPGGLKVLLDMFSKGAFGRCPRVYCQGQAVLPVGETDRPMQSSVKTSLLKVLCFQEVCKSCSHHLNISSSLKVFCPRCKEIYFPAGNLRTCDGAFFGTTSFALLLLGWPELKKSPSTSVFVPRVFGFKMHQIGVGCCESPG